MSDPGLSTDAAFDVDDGLAHERLGLFASIHGEAAFVVSRGLKVRRRASVHSGRGLVGLGRRLVPEAGPTTLVLFSPSMAPRRWRPG